MSSKIPATAGSTRECAARFFERRRSLCLVRRRPHPAAAHDTSAIASAARATSASIAVRSSAKRSSRDILLVFYCVPRPRIAVSLCAAAKSVE